MKKFSLFILAITLSAGTVFAGECKIKIARESCVGRESEAFKPYDGKKETEETKQVANEAACGSFADKSSKIVRKGIITSKKVIALFDGKDLRKTYEDKKDCK